MGAGNVKRHLDSRRMDVIEGCFKEILEALGADVDSEGLADTPKRVAKMFDEVFEGMRYTNQEIAEMFGKCFEEPNAENLVVMRDIECFSWCEHHMAMMYNMRVHVAYIPDGKVIGLSKIARIVDMVCRRLQLQERIGNDIAEIMELITGTHDVMVLVEGEHGCMTARGIQKPGTSTCSAVLHGRFRDSQQLRAEVYSIINQGRK